ncbi:MAG TPA: hypothetical protein VD931_14840 [Baekduia sp.]|nr:hypothetical protein [Baekduia sp.]
MATGLTALLLTPALLLGGAGGGDAALAEYHGEGGGGGQDVVICVYGYAEHTVSPEIAATLVASGVAEYGPCPPSIFNP